MCVGVGSSSKCLSYHTHMHTHNVTDTFPPTAMMSQVDSCRKLLASSQPHFSTNGFLSQLHPPRTPDICLPRILPSPMSTSLWCSFLFPPLLPASFSLLLSLNGGCALSMKRAEEMMERGKMKGSQSGGMCVTFSPVKSTKI